MEQEAKLTALERALQALYRAEREVVSEGPEFKDLIGYAAYNGHLAGLREAIRIVREISNG